MDERYKVELRDRDPTTVEDLILDNAKSDGKISGITDALVNLESLSMINCGLTSFEGMPHLPQLKRLDVSDNKISGGLDIIAKQCPALGALVLSRCAFEDLSELSALKASPVETLDMFDNPLAADKDYRDKVFEAVPTLKYLDGVSPDGDVLDDSDDDGEDEDFHGDDSGGSDSEDDGPGLSYLDSSQLVEDEDETEDYEPSDDKKGQKRKHDDDGDDEEPESKK